MRKLRNLLPLAAIVITGFAGCGENAPAPKAATTAAHAAIVACPQAATGHGDMGACVPTKLGLSRPPSTAQPAGITYPDLSNNDPCVCAAAIRAHGHPGEIDKANQGTRFSDSWFVSMVKDAKAHGLATGGYDFDELYTASEVYLFIKRLHAAGIYRSTPNTFAPTIDVEFGNFSREGLQHQINILNREFGRVKIYTGGWYFLPHAGCWWPKGVPAWLSGYPNASVFCGLSESLFKEHQYTDHGFNGETFSDMTVYRGNQAQFNAFVHKAPVKLTKGQKKEALDKEYRRRQALRVLRQRHGCGKGHKVTPNTRAFKRHACPAWTKHGGEANKAIKKFHKEGVF